MDMDGPYADSKSHVAAFYRRSSVTTIGFSFEFAASGRLPLATVEAGLSGASDEPILEFAIKEDRILLTLDADFANKLPHLRCRLRFSAPADNQTYHPGNQTDRKPGYYVGCIVITPVNCCH
jgi:hypothetical protein